MPCAATIIGDGQIGRAVARDLVEAGWRVTSLSRSGGVGDAKIDHRRVDRTEPGALARAIGDGADLLVDTIAFDADDAAQLLAVQDRVGAIVAISSSSVYRDARGRTLDEAATNGFPELPEKMTEEQPTVAPGPATYSTRKIAMERMLLDGARVPAATIRAGAIHGAYSRHPREWWFVKRIRDGRRRIPLAYNGESRFQPVASANIAALVRAIADARAAGPFNAADPDAPNALEIGMAVARAMNADVDFVPIKGPPSGTTGRHPWAIPRPFTLSMESAETIGYRPAGRYAGLVDTAVDWLIGQPADGWEERFPQLAAYPWNLFDYDAEDRAA
jgi:nucleoside-diphosphate-sugar epimerase